VRWRPAEHEHAAAKMRTRTAITMIEETTTSIAKKARIIVTTSRSFTSSQRWML
jgi:hypothetical protein